MRQSFQFAGLTYGTILCELNRGRGLNAMKFEELPEIRIQRVSQSYMPVCHRWVIDDGFNCCRRQRRVSNIQVANPAESKDY